MRRRAVSTVIPSRFVPIQISTSCEAGCRHCPFSVNDGHDIAPGEVSDIESTAALLTGGEPLGSEFLWEWVDYLTVRQVPFRIATGGHVPLAGAYLRLSRSPVFMGINVGTDVVLGRSPYDFTDIWMENWRLVGGEIHTVLTVTLDRSWKDELCALVRVVGQTPRVVMVNKVSGSEINAADVRRQLRALGWESARVLQGYW